ncbi:LA2681 family HEPN domain-containing protein [Clavibacter phaseoli]|uniref:LA2681 family HEPN domain-containing protein n=1 Tax=Clavibacter phaseoli TaxID=1734031 RepID=UPI0011C22B37|nr:LA2681 family HEPN domain-containing protein [Clavibacter phaseoli]
MSDFRRAQVSLELSAKQSYAALHWLSSLQIDAANRVGSVESLKLGITWAEEVHKADDAAERLAVLAGYNMANGLLAIIELDDQEYAKIPSTKAGLKRAPFKLQHREDLRRLRGLFHRTAQSQWVSPLERSKALTNLGNVLDESSRWVEAYESYSQALSAFPFNGNAAGNAAELLLRRMRRGGGLPGHYAAVYNDYVLKARAFRLYTVAIAGEAAAARWDELPLAEDVGHHSHEGNVLDEYQQWISRHRLALSGAIEGLGSDNPQWDDAQPAGVFTQANSASIPAIFSAMNILKAEYLVARRLVFDGESQLLALFRQSENAETFDTGSYVHTSEYELYGQAPARLILAQRAAVYILDKVAVAANLHFHTGLKPAAISFRNYWFDRGSGALRKKIPRPAKSTDASALLALAELSFDMDIEGLYSEATALRNAGTHRLVYLHLLEPGGVSEEAQNTVGLFELIDGCHETLQIIRSAYLYLLDLLDLLAEEVSENSHAVVHEYVPMQG